MKKGDTLWRVDAEFNGTHVQVVRVKVLSAGDKLARLQRIGPIENMYRPYTLDRSKHVGYVVHYLPDCPQDVIRTHATNLGNGRKVFFQ